MTLKAATYIPENLRESATFKNTADLLDSLFAKYDPELESLYKKYNSFFDSMDEEAMRAIISEFGYGYILDILILTADDLRSLLSYMALIQYLKGTRVGLELILNLLGITYELQEWWEASPPAEVLSATIAIDMDVSRISVDSNKKIRLFFRQYVYPLVAFAYKYSLPFNNAVALGGFRDRQIFTGGATAPVHFVAVGIADRTYGSVTTIGALG